MVNKCWSLLSFMQFALHLRFEFLQSVDKVFARKFDPTSLNLKSLWYSSSNMSFHSYHELWAWTTLLFLLNFHPNKVYCHCVLTWHFQCDLIVTNFLAKTLVLPVAHSKILTQISLQLWAQPILKCRFPSYNKPLRI